MPTAISWTDETWNPIAGCARVSAGCENCYAEKMTRRLNMMGKPGYEGLIDHFWAQDSGRWRWSGKIQLFPERLDKPLRWRKPRRIFVCSMSDLFHPDVPDQFIARVFAMMARASRHTFQVLTKRPERAARLLGDPAQYEAGEFAISLAGELETEPYGYEGGWPLPNVWLGTSVENQKAADERIPHLLATPAAVRFLSVEPLLGPINLYLPTKTWGPRSDGRPGCDHCCTGDRCDEPSHLERQKCPYCRGTGDATTVDWVIVGGESGPGARPCNVEWIRDIVRQCREAEVPCFMKQLGAWRADQPPGYCRLSKRRWSHPSVTFLADGSPYNAREPDGLFAPGTWTAYRWGGHGAEPNDWPNDLRVQEWPAETPLTP
jgi:protein gp37